jgi:hypothetical protein
LKRFILRIAAAAGLAAVPLAAGLAQGAGGGAASAPAPAPTAVRVQSPAEALAQDAAEYARLNGVSAEEAERRLRALDESVAATDRLQRTYRKRLAGLSIEHRPELRIVVLLTGRKPVRDQVVRTGALDVPVVFHTDAPATRERILEAMLKRGAQIRSAVPDARGMGVDPRSAALVVIVGDGAGSRPDPEALGARIAEIAGVPARVRMLAGAEANFSVEGGARIEGTDTMTGRPAYCTTGFVVTDGARRGIITAAHCPDALTYFDPAGGRTDLPFVGQWGWSYQDVQLNLSEEAQRPLFYVDAKKGVVRAVRGARGRASTRAGDLVCHRGERTGYSCGEVELTDYAPPGELCGGPCAPTWVTVSGPSCGGGDSGAPVFSGNVAYGIVKGGTYTSDRRCAFYYYMSLDYLPPGWSLLREGAPAPAASAVQPGYESPRSPR